MQRTPLAPIFANRVQKTELSPYQRGIIVGANRSGAALQEIAEATGLSKATVSSTISRATKRYEGYSIPREGRSKTLSDRQRRHLIRIVRLEPKILYKDLRERAHLHCSVRTIQRALKDYGITKWLAKKRPLLTPQVAALRLKWAKEHVEWTFEQWEKIIWSDECSVERGTGKRREWCFRMPDQKWDKDMIQGYRKGHDISLMVWACFWGIERSDLYAMWRDPDSLKKGYSANSYLRVLEDNLLGIWEPGLVFMQDNAPMHKARKVTE